MAEGITWWMKAIVKAGADELAAQCHDDQAALQEIFAARDDLLIWIDVWMPDVKEAPTDAS
jgi:hypothetical protein